MKQILRRLMGILFFLGLFVLTWFFVQANQESVQLYFGSWRTHEVALGMMVLLSFVAGILVATFLFASVIVASRLEAQRYRRENEAMKRIVDGKSA